jgi:predicted lipid-binding transport protein (Tim44 family)
MTIAGYLIITGILIGVLCAFLAIWGRGRLRDVVSVFLVVGILVAAVGVTIRQAGQYRQRQTVAEAAVPAPVAASGSSMRPAPHAVPILPPLGMRGATGAAAPNPYAGGAR